MPIQATCDLNIYLQSIYFSCMNKIITTITIDKDLLQRAKKNKASII